jgi:autotransporter-associated beta strand protein
MSTTKPAHHFFAKRLILKTAITALYTSAFVGSLFIAQEMLGATYTSGTYTQTFDDLFATVPGNNTTQPSSILPDGWSFVEAGANANTTLRVDPGTSGTGDTFLFGATGSNERAFGSYASGSLTSIFGLQLVNGSGGTLTQFTLTYDGEQWKDGGSSAAVLNKLTFSYGVGNSNLTTGTFTNVTALDFTALVNNTSADAAKDGNNAAFRTADISFTVTGLTWLDGQSLWLRWSDINDAGNDDGLGVDNVRLSATAGAVPATVTWNAISGAWDTTTGNWTGGSPTANLYKNTDTALFANPAGGTVTIQAGGVSPTAVTVSAASGTYNFTGGAILSGNLSKSGGGTLDLTGQAGGNSYTGGTSVTGGILRISADNQLGATTAALTLDNGTLQTTGAITTTRGLIIGTSGGTIATGGNNVAFNATGTATINGTLAVTGSGGNVTLGGSTTFGATGALNIATAASVTLAQATGTISMANGGVFNGDLIINTTARLNFNTDTATYGGTGSIKILGSALGAGSGGFAVPTTGFTNFNALISNLSGSTAGTVTSGVVLNPAGAGHVAWTPGDITTASYTTGSFLAFIGATSGAVGDGLTFNGVISGEGDLFIGNNSKTGGGSANLTLNAANTYAGNTLINVSNSIIKLGVDNALPVTTNVLWNILNGVSVDSTPALDLNGHNQQIASLSSGAAGTPGNIVILNNAGTPATFTISGAVTPANPFAGTIADGAGSIAVVKGGANTLTLTGANAYTGGTTIEGGTLLVSGSIQGETTVQNTGTLGGLGTVGDIDVLSGGALAPGTATPGFTLGTLTAAEVTLEGGSRFRFELSASDSTADKLAVNFLNKGSGPGGFQFDFLGGGKDGESYQLFTFNAQSGFAVGDFTFTNLGAGLTGSFVLTGGELDFTVAAVPEPSALAALLSGFLLLGCHRQRSRRA